jgi:hypothetical protein
MGSTGLVRARIIIAIAVGLLSLWPRTVVAQVPIPFGYGDQIATVGPIKSAAVAATIRERLKGDYKTFAERIGQPDRVATEVGFKYRQLVVGLPLWTWDGTYVVHRGHRFIPIEKAIAAALMEVNESDLKTPFFFRYPAGWVALPVVIPLLIVFAKVSIALNERRRRRAEAIYAASFDTSNVGTSSRVGSTLFNEKE